MSVADFVKTAEVMPRLLAVCSDSLRAAPLTAPLRLVRTLSKFSSVMSSCTCVNIPWLSCMYINADPLHGDSQC